MNLMLQAALRYCAAGLSVVPWAYDGDSKSTTRKWKLGEVPKMSSSDIEQWWAWHPNDNVGILTGDPSGIVTVDLDNAEAVSWAKAHLPATPWRVRTGRGEQWGYRQGEQSIPRRIDVFKNKRDPSMPKVDLMGTMGYVAMPPSMHKVGRLYAWLDQELPSIADLPLYNPEWLPTAEDVDAPQAINLQDGMVGDLETAKLWLSDEPPCIQGSGGRTQLFKVCCALLRDFALSWDQTWKLLWRYNKRCEPPWDDNDLVHHMTAAVERGSTPRGVRKVPYSEREKEHLQSEFDWLLNPTTPTPVAETELAPATEVRAVAPRRPDPVVATAKEQASAGPEPIQDFLDRIAAEAAVNPGAAFRADVVMRLAAISLSDMEKYQNFMHDVRKHLSLVDLRKAVVRAQKEMRRSLVAPAQSGEGEVSRERVVLTGDDRADRDAILAVLRKTTDIYMTHYRLAFVNAATEMSHLEGGAMRNAVANKAYLTFATAKEDGTLAYKAASLPASLLSMLENLLPSETKDMRQVDQITRSPIFTPTGDFIKEPGYVPETKTLIAECPDIDTASFPTVASALEYLRWIFKDFPFAGEAEWANYLGALLTPMLRHAYHGPTPWLLIEANTPGAGKSLLAKCIQILYGYNANTNDLPPEEKEIAKTLVTVLGTAKPVVIFDNVKIVIDSPSIEAVATSSDEYEARRLGNNDRSIVCKVRALFVITSNNARMGVDAARRILRVRLVKEYLTQASDTLPVLEIPDLENYVGQHRGRILSALARLALEWVADGMPASKTQMVLPSFEAFSRTIGGCLAHVGVTAWAQNAKDMIRNMQSLDEWIPFVHEWYAKFRLEGLRKTRPLLASELHDFAMQKALLGFMLSHAKDENAKRSYLGVKLTEKRDALVGDFIVRAEWSSTKQVNKYYIERVSGEDLPAEEPKKVVH